MYSFLSSVGANRLSCQRQLVRATRQLRNPFQVKNNSRFPLMSSPFVLVGNPSGFILPYQRLSRTTMKRSRVQAFQNKYLNRKFCSPSVQSGGASTNTGTTAASEVIPTPAFRQLFWFGFRFAIPMVGFGFMDNMIMINVGEFIDVTIGVYFGLSTLAAAGFGQIFSDVGGIAFGGAVDSLASKINLPHHNLTNQQLSTRLVRTAGTVGACCGVVVGCLLGMTCLLWLDTDNADRLKQQEKLQTIFDTVMEEGHNLCDAERCALWMVDDKTDELWTPVLSGEKKSSKQFFRLRKDQGIVGHVVCTGSVVNVENAHDDPRFDSSVEKTTGYETHSMLCVPVFHPDNREKVIGAIQMVNKKSTADDMDGISDLAFDENDERLVQMLCSHVAIFKSKFGLES